MLTPRAILADIASPRVKKVVVDSDTYNEMDDQYAVAYAIGSPRMEVLALHAAPFRNARSKGFADGLEKSCAEMRRVLDRCRKTGEIPVFEGSRTPVTENPGFGPTDSPAARDLIRLAHETGETLYVLSLGAITNVVSAVLLDPSIREKICVIWLGGNCLDYRDLYEFNLCQDQAAGQLLLNLEIPLVLLPAMDHGTSALLVERSELNEIRGDSPACRFFREELPAEFLGDEGNVGHARVIWDIAAPGVLAVPEAYTFSVIPAPVFGDDYHYAFDRTRRPIVFMEKVERDPIVRDAFRSIGSL
jgi:inosine-uridine nucleoside N-ribohydrolase